MSLRTDYLHEVFRPEEFKVTVENTVAAIKAFREKNNFEVILFTGVSGAALAFPTSYLTGIPIACLRKPSSSHSIYTLEGWWRPGSSYIIIDDFVETGDTINRIHERVKPAVCKGIYLYKDEFTVSAHSEAFAQFPNVPIIPHIPQNEL